MNRILHLLQGNIQFESDGESVQIQGLEAVHHISELCHTNQDSVSKSLLYRTVATGGREVIEKGHTEQEACFGRDAFAKVPLSVSGVLYWRTNVSRKLKVSEFFCFFSHHEFYQAAFTVVQDEK